QASKRIVIPAPVLGGVRSLRDREGLLLVVYQCIGLKSRKRRRRSFSHDSNEGIPEHHVPSQSLFCRQQDVSTGLRLHSAPRCHCPRRANRNPLLWHLPFGPASSPR